MDTPQNKELQLEKERKGGPEKATMPDRDT